MENIKFIGAENEIQKIYSDLGLIVPVGDLDNGKAPGFKVYEVKYNEDGEDSAVNATIQIYCNSEGGGLYALYKTSDIEELFPNGVPTNYDLDAAINDPESQDPIKNKMQYAYGGITFRKDMYTLSMPTNNDDSTSAVLPYDDYTLIMSVYTCPNECMNTTVTSQFSAIAPPNWATADEVLDGNKFIGEDGQEAVGTYVPEGGLENQAILEYSQGLFPFYYDYDAQQEVSFPWKCTAVCDIPQDASLQLPSFNVYFNYVEGDIDASAEGGQLYFESSTTIVGDKLVITGFSRDSLEFSDWCNKYSPDNNMVAELSFDPIDTTAPDAQSVVVAVPCTFSAELYETPECQ